MPPPPEQLTKGLGAFLVTVAAGKPTTDLQTWDYPLIDVAGWTAPIAYPLTPVLVIGFHSQQWALACSPGSWPRPDRLVRLPVLYTLQLIGGPREHTTVVNYLSPGQWVTLGLYDQWVAAGSPSSVVCGQHDNTAGGPSGLAILATLLPVIGGAVGAIAGSPQAGAAAGGAAGAIVGTIASQQAGQDPTHGVNYYAGPPVPAAPSGGLDLAGLGSVEALAAILIVAKLMGLL